MILQASVLIVTFFSIIFCFGYLFLRRIIKENRFIYLIPLSVCFGSSFFVILLHFFSLILGVKTSSYVVLVMLFLTCFLILWKFKSKSKIVLGIGRTQFIILIFFSSFFSLLALAYLLKFDTYDQYIYLLIGTITKQNEYPPLNPNGPDLPLVYHWGMPLFASSLKIFSNLDPWLCTIPIQVIFIFICPIAIFLLVYSSTNNFLQSIFGSLIGCFCANLISLKFFFLFNPNVSNDLINHFYRNLLTMSEGGLVTSTSKALISPNSSVAIPLSLILFLLCTHEKTFNRGNLFITLIISTFLFFTYESFWLPVIISIFLYQLVLILKSKNKINQLKVSTLLLSLLLISSTLTGGVLTNKNENVSNFVKFEPKAFTYSYSVLLPLFYSQEWLSKNEFVSHSDGYRFYKIPLFSNYFLIEFGLPLILLPLVTFWLLKFKNKNLILFLISGLIALTVPFFISFTPRAIEVIRFFVYARFVFSILLGAFFGFVFNIKLKPIASASLRIALLLLLTSLALPNIAWLFPIKTLAFSYRDNVISCADKETLRWLYKNAISGDRGIGPKGSYPYFELISIAGVYSVGAHHLALLEQETRNTALTTLDPCLLKELKVRWIYLNNELALKLPKEKLEKLIKERTLVLRYKYKNKKEMRTIYEFIPSKNNESCKTKNYIWAIGKIQNGEFLTLVDEKTKSPLAFTNKENSLLILNQLKKRLNPSEVFWYRVEAVKSQL